MINYETRRGVTIPRFIHVFFDKPKLEGILKVLYLPYIKC